MEKFKQLFASRKFWATLIGLIMTVVLTYVPDFPIPEDQILGIVLLVVSYVLGTALEDGLRGQ